MAASSPGNDRWQPLVDVLDQMAGCIGALQSLRERGRQLLLTESPSAVLDLAALAEEELARLERLDRQRLSLEEQLGERPEQLLASSPGPGGEYPDLHAAYARLAAALVAAARTGAGTGLLAHSLLNWVDDRLAFIRRLDGALATYAGNGAPASAPRGWQGSVDRRA